MKNTLDTWGRDYENLENDYNSLVENFNYEVNQAFLKSRRDALMEASQEKFDKQYELAKVLDLIEKNEQPTETPSPDQVIDISSPTVETPGVEEPLSLESTAEVTIIVTKGNLPTTQPSGTEIPMCTASLEVSTEPNEVATPTAPITSVTSEDV